MQKDRPCASTASRRGRRGKGRLVNPQGAKYMAVSVLVVESSWSVLDRPFFPSSSPSSQFGGAVGPNVKQVTSIRGK